MSKKVALHIAEHNKTGKKYFSKTIRYFTEEDLQKHYHGSGTYWANHLKKHGDDVTMRIYRVCSLDENSDNYVGPIAMKFSEENNIVDSDKWANLVHENGLDGVGPNVTASFRQKVGSYSKGKAVFIDENGKNVKIPVNEAKERGLIAESKGRKYSNEVNKSKGRKGVKNANLGKKQSKETKLKIGKSSSNTVTCFDLETGKRLRIHKDIFNSSERYVGSSSKKIKEYYENKKN